MSPTPTPIHLRVTTLPTLPDFQSLLARLQNRPGLIALDSAAGEPNHWSWIAFDPSSPERTLPQDLQDLRDHLTRAYEPTGDPIPGPFRGGFMGALAYDQGISGENQDLPADPWAGPRVVGGIYTRFFVFDHAARQAHLVTDANCSPEGHAQLVQLASQTQAPLAPTTLFTCTGPIQRKTPSALHQARIETARAQIAAGEYFQTNLAHVFEAPTQGDPFELYLELRRVNPAPYMAYLRFDGGAILSASPELLLQVQGDQLLTRPIKGTARRSSDDAQDAALAAGLLASEKDRAELAMIVDLLRNDLGRVARIGSVQVKEFPELRSYAAVHHLMADVSARLAPGKDVWDALLSVFPGGSITGAPKLRAMQAIAELEGEGRGFFTGSAGYVDFTGNACFNILIRTLQWRARGVDGAGEVRFHVGGGITWSSNAHDEDQETLLKGGRMARALGFDLDMNELAT